MATFSASPSRWPRASRERGCPTGRPSRARGPSSRRRCRRRPVRCASSATVLYFGAPLPGQRASASRTTAGSTCSGSRSSSPVGASVISEPVSRGPALDEVVGHRPLPRAQGVRRVVRRRLGGQPVEQLLGDRQRQHPLHVAEPQREAAAARELRPRFARTVRPGGPGPEGLGVEQPAPMPTGLLLEPGQHRRAEAAPLRIGSTWTASVALSRLSSSGVDSWPTTTSRPSTDRRRRRSSGGCRAPAARPGPPRASTARRCPPAPARRPGRRRRKRRRRPGRGDRPAR